VAGFSARAKVELGVKCSAYGFAVKRGHGLLGATKISLGRDFVVGREGQRVTQRREVQEAQLRTICGVWSVIN